MIKLIEPSFLCSACVGEADGKEFTDVEEPYAATKLVLWQTVRLVQCSKCKKWVPDLEITVTKNEKVIK